MDKIKEIFFKYKETIMYLIVGGLVTVVNWGCYAILSKAFEGIEHDVAIANMISWIISVTFAYVTNKIFVFESYSWEKSLVIKEIGLFFSSRFLTGLLELIGVPFLVERVGLDGVLFGIKGMGVKVFVSIIIIILNYVFSKLLIFKKNEEAQDGAGE